jgi:hypothetical protein
MASYYQPDWTAGTVTLTSGSTAFTVASADLVAIGVQPGDEIYHTTTGRWLIIDSVTDSTHGALAYACPADLAGAGLPLRIRFQPDGSRFAAAYLNALQKFKGGNLDALAGLTGAADKLAYFTGAGTMDLVALASVARSFLAANFYPIQQGGGPSQGTNKLQMGWADAFVRVAVDNTDVGRLWGDREVSSTLAANGHFKFPGGFMAQWGNSVTETSDYVQTFETAFANACLCVVGSVHYPDGSTYPIDAIFAVAFDQYSKTGCAVRKRLVSDGGSVIQATNAIGVQYLAIGY